MTIGTPPTQPPSNELRREWADWFFSMWRYVVSTSETGLKGAVNKVSDDLTAHTTDKDNPHETSLLNLTSKNHSDLDGVGSNSHAAIDGHIADTDNPHATNLDQVYAQPSSEKIYNRDALRYSLMGA